ncbi:trypsin-like peptidase domain-containing protein [Pararhizobium sp. BT-229]|uniref:trypsin-like peptidase domain-containing protein n=1 Tax=Pararhizobium sp. BT-229 TaxID=2986923 RepID=UPI0021F7564E|nr:trypsin-like peptidase domain-containing protein [Pararhizobium sp. BT-229]MCV9963376.1 trypsin-like peptidase domain-containing protein [Pararhizobium sp. BT-229]
MAIDKDLVSSIVAEILKKLEEMPPKPAAASLRLEIGATVQSPRDLERRPPGQKDVPFIKAYDKVARPFEDLAGSHAVDDPEKMLKGWTRSEEFVVRPELAVGKYVTSPAALLQVLADRRRAVAIITAEGLDFRGEPSAWSGTGFLVAPNILLTNHHVLNSREVASSARVEFNYEVSPENVLVGSSARPQAIQSFSLDPQRLFVTSPLDGGLDYTFVWIEGGAHSAFGAIPMERASFTVDKGDQAFIIHHPDGRPKEVSLDDTEILHIDSKIIHYASDTEGGSSGSCVFDKRGRLIAVHHASVEKTATLQDGTTTDVVNEGIKIAAIAMDLENMVDQGGELASQAEMILKNVKGSDTISGFFGARGRQPDAAQLGVEAVVDAYRGNDQDIDIGFWNIEWLANRWDDRSKLEGAARVIADLNMDAWGLVEVSPSGVKALVDEIRQSFGDQYDYLLSEPNSPDSKQSTAMMWRRTLIEGEAIAWPPEIEALLRMRSDDPAVGAEAVHGKIFDRYPAATLFRTVEKTTPYSFIVVPLHLKAMDEGSLRRRLASRILARGVAALIEEYKVDVILGGDVNAPLASGDFEIFEKQGFAILGAQDEKEGAFSYLKSPRSAIDNVFLSPGMTQTIGDVDYFIIAKEKSMSNFVKNVSDHRPVAMRLSLAKSTKSPIREENIDELIDRLIDRQKAATPRVASRRRR